MALRKLFTSAPATTPAEAEPAPPAAASGDATAPPNSEDKSQEKDADTAKTTTGDIGAKLAESSVLDLVFAMDCTGSMGSYIHSAQESVRAMIQTIVESEKSDVRFALVSYRDHPPQDHSFVTKTYPFTKSISTMRRNLDTLSAAGGGDGPEAVADALHAITKLDFRPEATKIAVLIADAPPHGLSKGHDGFPNGCPDGLDPIQVCRNLAQMGVSLYSVGCEPAISPYRDFFQGLAHITGGQYAPLSSAAGLSNLIVGGAREEICLERMQGEVDEEVAATVAAGGVAPPEQEQVQRVYDMMVKRGRQSKQLSRGKAAMASPSAQSYAIAEMDSLAAVKSSYAPSAAPSSAAKGGRGGSMGGFRSVFSRSRAAPARCAAASMAPAMAPAPGMSCDLMAESDLMAGSAAADDAYTLSSSAVSMEQCQRMVKKSKARNRY